jgi:hypothetical protein
MLRNTVLAFAVIGFASMASGLTLQLHLTCAEDADHHDAADCSLCHAILLGAAKFQLDTQSPVVCTHDLVGVMAETPAVLHRRLALSTLGPRPPPLGVA